MDPSSLLLAIAMAAVALFGAGVLAVMVVLERPVSAETANGAPTPAQRRSRRRSGRRR